MIQTLIDRLSKLDAPDREVDALIGKHFFPNEAKSFFDFNAPAYTASVDAVIALAGRVLPGWKRQLFEDFNGKWIARICSQRRELFSTDYLRETELGGSPNGAIALLIAILRAKEDSHGE